MIYHRGLLGRLGRDLQSEGLQVKAGANYVALDKFLSESTRGGRGCGRKVEQTRNGNTVKVCVCVCWKKELTVKIRIQSTYVGVIEQIEVNGNK